MNRQIRRLKAYFEPLYRERLALCEKHPIPDSDYDEPQDMMQFMMRYAQENRLEYA